MRKSLNPTFSLLLRTSINTPLNSLVRRMSSEPNTHRMFQLKLDPLTGNSEWVIIEDRDDDQVFDQSPKPLLASTSYLDMLNDSRRNRAFRLAIDKTVTKPCHVLDIGAGTGLLSMMAARAMGSGDSMAGSSARGMVTACESYLPMVKLMRKVLHANGMEKKVRVINKRSDELEIGIDISSRANVLVSEILDSELLGEGLIPTLQHAHDKLLVENPQTVPYRATTYGQLVESTYLWKLHDLYNNEARVSDGIHIVPEGMETVLSFGNQQFPMHCDALIEEIKLLSEPFKIFEFDFWKRPDSFGNTELLIKATNDGTVHAVVSWWVLQLDREGTIFYSTGPKWIRCPFEAKELHSSPGCKQWCDHWKQCVWFVPGQGLSISKDEEVQFHATHADTSILYKIQTQSWRSNANICTQDCQLNLSPERIAIYGDVKWRNSMLKAVKDVLQRKTSPMCVVLDDSIFLAIAIAQFSKNSHIISMFPGLRDKGSQYLQAIGSGSGYSIEQLEVLKNRTALLTMCDTCQKKIDILIAEPFYYGTDLLPWQNMRFWKERTMIDSVLSKDIIIMPCRGILRACAMSLPDLWKSRCCLQKIEGFDHSSVNATLGACTDESPCLPFFLWQCGDVMELSEIFTLMEFDFYRAIGPCAGKAQVKYTKAGICHGFALWMDWVLDAETVISTGPDQRYWKQGVKLLSEPVTVGSYGSCAAESCSAEVEASFDPSTGDLDIKFAFL